MDSTFSGPQAARITGITERMLKHWIAEGIMTPQVMATGRGSRRRFSFRDLVTLQLIRRLRESGISLQAIKQTSARLAEYDASLADSAYIYATDTDIYLQREDDLISMLRKPGQKSFTWIYNMTTIKDEVTEAIAALAA